MRLQARLSLRNDAMLAWRQERDYTQGEAAEAVGIPKSAWMSLEKLCYPASFNEDRVLSMSARMGVSPDDIMTPELVKHRTETIEKTFSISPKVLLESGCRQHNFILPSPDESILIEDAVSHIIKEHFKYLTEAQTRVLKLRFGFENRVGLSLIETAKAMKLSPARVGQLESGAIRKLKHLQERDDRLENLTPKP